MRDKRVEKNMAEERKKAGEIRMERSKAREKLGKRKTRL